MKGTWSEGYLNQDCPGDIKGPRFQALPGSFLQLQGETGYRLGKGWGRSTSYCACADLTVSNSAAS